MPSGAVTRKVLSRVFAVGFHNVVHVCCVAPWVRQQASPWHGHARHPARRRTHAGAPRRPTQKREWNATWARLELSCFAGSQATRACIDARAARHRETCGAANSVLKAGCKACDNRESFAVCLRQMARFPRTSRVRHRRHGRSSLGESRLKHEGLAKRCSTPLCGELPLRNYH